MLRRVCPASLATVGVSARTYAVGGMSTVVQVQRVKDDDALVAAAIEKASKMKKKKANLRLIKDYKLGKKARDEEAKRRAAHKKTPVPFQLSDKGAQEAATPANKNPRHMHIESPTPLDGMPTTGQRFSSFEPRMVALNINN